MEDVTEEDKCSPTRSQVSSSAARSHSRAFQFRSSAEHNENTSKKPEFTKSIKEMIIYTDNLQYKAEPTDF